MTSEQYANWDKINTLAKEYYAEVQNGKNIIKDGKGGYDDNRSSFQKNLARKIVAGTTKFLYKIACEMLYGNGFKAPYSSRKFSLKHLRSRITVDDLVGEGVLSIIYSLGNYEPMRSSISTFIACNAASAMYKAGSGKAGLIKIPERKFAGKIDIQNPTIKNIVKKIGNIHQASTIYLGLTNRYTDMHSCIQSSRHFRHPLKFEEIYLADETADTEKQVIAAELNRNIQKALATLSPREEMVMRLRFGINGKDRLTLEEIAQLPEFSVSRERIRRIEERALRKLRHNSRSKYLKDF